MSSVAPTCMHSMSGAPLMMQVRVGLETGETGPRASGRSVEECWLAAHTLAGALRAEGANQIRPSISN